MGNQCKLLFNVYLSPKKKELKMLEGKIARKSVAHPDVLVIRFSRFSLLLLMLFSDTHFLTLSTTVTG